MLPNFSPPPPRFPAAANRDALPAEVVRLVSQNLPGGSSPPPPSPPPQGPGPTAGKVCACEGQRDPLAKACRLAQLFPSEAVRVAWVDTLQTLCTRPYS